MYIIGSLRLLEDARIDAPIHLPTREVSRDPALTPRNLSAYGSCPGSSRCTRGSETDLTARLREKDRPA